MLIHYSLRSKTDDRPDRMILEATGFPETEREAVELAERIAAVLVNKYEDPFHTEDNVTFHLFPERNPAGQTAVWSVQVHQQTHYTYKGYVLTAEERDDSE